MFVILFVLLYTDNTIDHFRVTLSLCFKARLSNMKWLLILRQMKPFDRKHFALCLFLKVRVFGTRKWPIKSNKIGSKNVLTTKLTQVLIVNNTWLCCQGLEKRCFTEATNTTASVAGTFRYDASPKLTFNYCIQKAWVDNNPVGLVWVLYTREHS